MKIKGITFDLEGTSVNIETVHHQAHILAAHDMGIHLDLSSAIEKIPHFIGGPDNAVAEDVLKFGEKKINSDNIQLFIEKKYSYYAVLLGTVEIKPRRGFIETVEEIKKLGLKAAIGSLTNKDKANLILEKSGLSKIFPIKNIVLREDVEKTKPNPDVFIETAKRMGISSSEQIVFDDSSNGIRAAVAARFIPIGIPVYSIPEILIPIIEAGAMRIFSEWDEINIENLIENFERI